MTLQRLQTRLSTSLSRVSFLRSRSCTTRRRRDKQVIAHIFHVLPDDFSTVEQQWETFESSRQTITTLTTKLNTHKEKLNRRAATTETVAIRLNKLRHQRLTAMTRRRRKTVTERRKQSASSAERRDILRAIVVTRRTVVKTAARRKKRRSAHTWTQASRRTAGLLIRQRRVI